MTLPTEPYVSIVIPLRNGMPLVERCLKSVLKQDTPWPFEIIAIDSSSTDGTWELLQSLPIRCIRIDPPDFNHGRTRNLGAGQARGEFIVFLVQDAVPADTHWLVNLVAAAERPGVAGAYSRQIPRAESTLITKYMAIGTTPESSTPDTKVLPPLISFSELPPPERFRLALFQDNSSCIRRSVFERQPFNSLPYGEDMEWGKRAIEAGHALVYEPRSTIFHSHDRSPVYALKRAYADHYECAQLFDYVLVRSLAFVLRNTAWQTLKAWRYVLDQNVPPLRKLGSTLVAPFFLISVSIGQYLGPRMFHWLPGRTWLRKIDRALRVGV